MRRLHRDALANALTSALIVVAIPLGAQQLEPLTDPEAYAIYAKVVPQTWSRRVEPVVLQRETEVERSKCSRELLQLPNESWRSALDNFHAENVRPRELRPELLINFEYRLIDRSAIVADDARLALKYPGTWNRRPESMEYAAVSSVGFNPDKTKAVVYVRLRGNGSIHLLEKRDGTWFTSGGGCYWIV